MSFNRIFFIFFIFLFFSCSDNSYEKVMEEYFTAIKSEDFNKAYSFLSSEDKAVLPIEEFSKKDESALVRKINRNINYKIIYSNIYETKNSATVHVEVNKISLMKLYHIIPALAAKELTEKDIENIFLENKRIIKSCNTKDLAKFNLVKENGAWKINAGFGIKKRIDELFEEAAKLLSENDYDAALSKYKNILDFDDTNSDALNKISSIEEKKSLIDKSIKANIDSWKSSGGKAFINISVENKGNIAIKKVYAKFIFLNNKNEVFTRKEELLKSSGMLGFENTKKTGLTLDVSNSAFDEIKCSIIAIDY
jgi:hypothetical protein